MFKVNSRWYRSVFVNCKYEGIIIEGTNFCSSYLYVHGFYVRKTWTGYMDRLLNIY